MHTYILIIPADRLITDTGMNLVHQVVDRCANQDIRIIISHPDEERGWFVD